MSIQLAVFDLAGTTVVDENFVGTPFRKHFTILILKLKRMTSIR
jgi:hypothetical protein